MGSSPTPLLDALNLYASRNTMRFHMPGHKGFALPDGLWPDVCRLDVTELPETGDLYREDRHGPIRRAEKLFADTYGAADAVFLTGGASQGIFAVLAAAVRPGGRVLTDRLCHMSVCHAMALLDMVPEYLPRGYRLSDGVPLPVTAGDVERALVSDKSYSAVFVTSPTYHGVCSDLDAIADVCHRHGVVLLADAAHGAHLPFLSGAGCVQTGLGRVDAAVISAHKTLPALGQAAVLLTGQSGALDIELLRGRAQMAGTSSPSYPIMASLDAARAFLDRRGRQAGMELCRILDGCRNPMLLERGPGFDPLRLVVRCKDAERVNVWLREHGVVPEMIGGHTVVFIVSLSERPCDLTALLGLLDMMYEAMPDNLLPPDDGQCAVTVCPEVVMSVRDAVFCAERVTLPMGAAVGMTAAAPFTPYPPGVPLLMPGERLDERLAAGYPGELHDFVSRKE